VVEDVVDDTRCQFLPAVTIKLLEIKTMDISDAAPQVGKGYGSIVLRYHSAFSSSLYASLMLHDTAIPLLCISTPYQQTTPLRG
jgi:hypothetical protein